MDATTKLFVGVDIGGTRIKFGLLTEDGKVLSKRVCPVPESRESEQVIDLIVSQVKDLLKGTDENETWNVIQGVGVGCPGIIDFEQGILKRLANFPTWTQVPLKDILETKLGKPVYIENDANTALLSELWTGAAGCRNLTNLDNVCMLTLGTGIGAAIIANGTFLRGATGMAGEVGHCIIEPNGKRLSTSTGVNGIFEEYASARAIGNTASKRLKTSLAEESSLRKVMSSKGSVSAEDVFNAAKEGDAFGLAVYDEACDYIAVSCINLCRILDPTLILLAGGLAESKEFLLQGVRCKFEERYWKLTKPTCRIELAHHKEDAGIIGAAFCLHPDCTTYLG